jgi:hypothetical protein
MPPSVAPEDRREALLWHSPIPKGRVGLKNRLEGVLGFKLLTSESIPGLKILALPAAGRNGSGA